MGRSHTAPPLDYLPGTWGTVPVGDPYLYLTLRAVESGTYVITTNITSDTYTWNKDIPTITINAQEIPTGSADNESGSSEASAASETISMQKTGTPINYLLLAVLMVISELLIPKRK